jgi:putative ABC transport system permease protein
MNAADLIALATDAPRRHRVRTGLSVAGIAVGVAAVLVLTSLGEGVRNYVVDEFVGLGTNVVGVLPGKVETTGAIGVFGGTTHDLTIDDAIAIQRRCPAVLRSAPISLGEAPIEFGAAGRQVPVVGTTPDYLEIRDFHVRAGRSLPGGDPHRGERVCLIGNTVQAEVFRGSNPLGVAVRIGEWRFRVIGVLEAKGNLFGVDMDDVVLVPVRSAMRMFDRTSLFRVLVQARTPAHVDDALRQIEAVLLDRHDGEEDFTLKTQGAMLETFSSIFRALTAAVGAITTEIGLMKAVGAGPRQILRLFLTEALVLAGAGAGVGVAVGALTLSAIGTFFPDVPGKVDAAWLGVAVGLALGTGALFGVLPARRAARVEPAHALTGRV